MIYIVYIWYRVIRCVYIYTHVSWGNMIQHEHLWQFPGEPVADQLCYYEGYKAQAGETFEQQLKRQLVEDMKDRGRRLLRLKGGSTSPKAILRNMKGGIRWIMWLMFGSNVLMTPGVSHGIFPCDFSMAFPHGFPHGFPRNFPTTPGVRPGIGGWQGREARHRDGARKPCGRRAAAGAADAFDAAAPAVLRGGGLAMEGRGRDTDAAGNRCKHTKNIKELLNMAINGWFT